MSDSSWNRWRAARPEPEILHLDSAAAGRSSSATLDATAAHARREAATGAYVAQQDAAPVLDRLRADLGTITGFAPECIAFSESATAAVRALLHAWPLAAGARVGVLPVEWGPNVLALQAHGYVPVPLPADGDGGLDLDGFAAALSADPPDAVHLTHVTSHRGLVQPVAAAETLCRAAGVPLWVDAAQAIGHVDVATGADALYATSRKWLTGPRGVGVIAVRTDAPLRVEPAPMGGGSPLESHEAHVAGRVGLANAVREYLAAGPPAVHARLADVGRQTRAALAGVEGWEVVGVASAITALRPTAGQDVYAVRARLLAEHGILTTAGGTERAPGDMTEPLLRASPHVDVTASELERLHDALMTQR